MRIRRCWRWSALLVLTVAGACQEQALGPSARPRVTLTLHELPPGAGALATPRIYLDGDSVVAVTAISVSGCYDYSGTGDAPVGLLVLSLVQRETPRYCIPEGVVEGATIVAHDVPSGFRKASLIERVVQLDGSGHEIVSARADIDVP